MGCSVFERKNIRNQRGFEEYGYAKDVQSKRL